MKVFQSLKSLIIRYTILKGCKMHNIILFDTPRIYFYLTQSQGHILKLCRIYGIYGNI